MLNKTFLEYLESLEGCWRIVLLCQMSEWVARREPESHCDWDVGGEG